MSPARQFRGTRSASLTIRRIGGGLCAVVITMAFAACGAGIGDGCDTALNCSASATRLCDRTQPGGYCTLGGCQQGSCPDDAVCVTFWQNTQRSDADRNRLSTNYCMMKCEETSDCRDSEGYRCVTGPEFGFDGEATVEGQPNARFCAARSPEPAPLMSGGS